MEENKILSESLLEWTLAEKTFWLDAKESDNKELVSIAKKRGIEIPSPDFALFKTYYAEVGKANRNNVLLNKAPVEKGLKTLIGKQINIDHLGEGHVCGFILDAKLEKEMIVVYGCIFKSLFRDKFPEIKAKFDNGELFVSFEIWNIDPETEKSVVTYSETGTKIIDPVLFHGCGLLLRKPPACPKARVLALLASENINILEAEEYKSENRNKDDRLVYAELSLPCQNCESCKSKGENKMAEEIKVEVKATSTEEKVVVEEAKIIQEPIDPNVFAKEDGSLDEEKLEASLPKEVTKMVKELIKEKNLKPSEAVKEAWKVYRDNKGVDKAALRCEKCGYSEIYERPIDKCLKCGAPMKEEVLNPEQNQEGGQTSQQTVGETVKEETVVAQEASEAPQVTTEPVGRRQWKCPDCTFTQPLLSEDSKDPNYCPACGKPYFESWDENPVCSEIIQDVELPNEELINQDEMENIDDAKKLEYKNRQTLPDTDFALVVKKGDKKIRMYPINDEAHIRNALARLGQAKPRATLKSLGVSVESVKNKILARARKLGMTELLNRYKETSSIEEEAILNLSTIVADLTTKLDKATVDLDKISKDKAVEVANLTKELEQKTQEINTLTAEKEAQPELSVGSVVEAEEKIKKTQKHVDELAFGKKKDKK